MDPVPQTIAILIYGLVYWFIALPFLSRSGCPALSAFYGHSGPPLYFVIAFVHLLFFHWCVFVVIAARREGLRIFSTTIWISVANLVFVVALGFVHYKLWQLISFQHTIEQVGVFPGYHGQRLAACWVNN